MNQTIKIQDHRLPTQAAEGLPRWRWTTEELLRLAKSGAFTREDRFELIGGEIVPMSPRGRRHEVVADELVQVWNPRAGADVRIGAERQFNLDDETYTNPDILVRPATIKAPDVRGPAALLVVEVADSSLDYDRGAKAALYAAHGVREYWVIEAWSLATTVHREPVDGAYTVRVEYPAADTLTPTLAPALAVRLADLPLS